MAEEAAAIEEDGGGSGRIPHFWKNGWDGTIAALSQS